MDHNIEKNFIQGIRTLEDIYKLGGIELSPLIDRVHHHLFEIRRQAQDYVEGVECFRQIKLFLETQIDRMIYSFFKDCRSYAEFDYWKQTESLTLNKWNLILEILPEVFELIQLFELQEAVSFGITSRYIELKAGVSVDEELVGKREKAYKITRNLLKNRCLLTFDVFESAKDDLFYMSFKVDHSHSDREVYACYVNNDTLLGFSNIFAQYTLDRKGAFFLGSHLCLLIHEDGTIEKRKSLPKLCFENEFDGEIFHFSFLFRPVSIIMKRRGKLFSHTGLVDYLDSFVASNQDSFKGQQELGKKYKVRYLDIDFFSFFNS